MSDSPCKRCGDVTPSYTFETDRTFWGLLEATVTTEVDRTVRLRGTQWTSGRGSAAERLLDSRGEYQLCVNCWGMLVGRFLQGREISALDSKASA